MVKVLNIFFKMLRIWIECRKCWSKSRASKAQTLDQKLEHYKVEFWTKCRKLSQNIDHYKIFAQILFEI